MLQIVLKRMSAGELQQDFPLLRHVANLVSLLPAVDSPEFNEQVLALFSLNFPVHFSLISSLSHFVSSHAQFLVEHNDALLTAYLASITKEITTFDRLISKYLTISEKHTSRRRGIL